MEYHDNYQTWFVYDRTHTAASMKMESALMDFAAKRFLHCLIYESELDNLVKTVSNRQERIWAENKRLVKVEVSLSKIYRSDEDTRWLHIGRSALMLRKVRKDADQTLLSLD